MLHGKDNFARANFTRASSRRQHRARQWRHRNGNIVWNIASNKASATYQRQVSKAAQQRQISERAEDLTAQKPGRGRRAMRRYPAL